MRWWLCLCGFVVVQIHAVGLKPQEQSSSHILSRRQAVFMRSFPDGRNDVYRHQERDLVPRWCRLFCFLAIAASPSFLTIYKVTSVFAVRVIDFIE